MVLYGKRIPACPRPGVVTLEMIRGTPLHRQLLFKVHDEILVNRVDAVAGILGMVLDELAPTGS